MIVSVKKIPHSEMFRKLHFRNTPFERGNGAVPPFKGGAEERGGGFFIIHNS